jgi:hypothetical protein
MVARVDLTMAAGVAARGSAPTVAVALAVRPPAKTEGAAYSDGSFGRFRKAFDPLRARRFAWIAARSSCCWV